MHGKRSQDTLKASLKSLDINVDSPGKMLRRIAWHGATQYLKAAKLLRKDTLLRLNENVNSARPDLY